MDRPRTLQILFAITMLSLVSVSILTYRNLEQYDKEHQAIRTGHLSLRMMEAMLSSIKGAENALLQFRDGRDTSALDAMREAEQDLNFKLELATALATDNDQIIRLDSLSRLIRQALTRVEGLRGSTITPTDTVARRQVNDALSLLRATRGIHGRMVRAREGSLRYNREEERHMGLTTPLLLLFFALLALTAVSVLFIRAFHAINKAARAEQEIQQKVEQLDEEVTRREFAQRSLKRVLDSSISGIMAFRAVRNGLAQIIDLEWIMVNHQTELMLARSADELMGGRLLEILPGAAASGLFDRFVDVVNTGNALRLDNVHDINGLGLRLDVHGVKLADGLVVSYTDVSGRERQRAILRESEQLALTGKIARTIAHEVRNPLTNVLLALDQIKEEAGTSSPLLPYAEIVQRNVDRIAHLITEMLDSSKPRETIRKPCDMPAILKDAVDLVRDRIDLKHLGFTLDVAPHLPIVHVDRNEILLALSNIIVNALEAMEEGKGRLRITASEQAGQIIVVVHDNGKGMEEEELSRLFDPFYTGRPGGMGLGLTTARSILNSHGVHVDVTSHPGKGTSFTLLFPIAP